MTVPANPTPSEVQSVDVQAYLRRIGYRGTLEPTAETLRALHVAHLYAVPFENLDIHLGRPLSLEVPALFDKIVAHRRGGFCYELNGLFAWLLQGLGYTVTYLSARVARSDGSLGPEFDHLPLWVECPADGSASERWLADVGFGDSFVEPLRLVSGREQAQDRRTYALEERDGRYLLWQRELGGASELQYGFTLEPRRFPDDYEPMCHYHQTSPQSHFTQHRVCTLATPAGRMTLSDRRSIVTEDGQRNECAIDDEEFWRIVKADFGMALDA